MNVNAAENCINSVTISESKNYEEQGFELIDTIALENGIGCEVYKKVITNKGFSDSTSTVTKTVTLDFGLVVNGESIGYLEQITKWKIDNRNRPVFKSGSDKLYAYDTDKYKLTAGETSVTNYLTSCKMYTRRTTLKKDGRSIGTTDFSTIVDKYGTASPKSKDVG